MRAWGITDGSAGMVAQVQALASALDIPVEMKIISIKKILSWQPNSMYAAGFKYTIMKTALNKKKSSALDLPLPDLVISCGRKAALVAMGMRYEMQKKEITLAPARFIHIQDPQCDAANYDLVIAMTHDKITGPNVIKTRFALHHITRDALENAHTKFSPLFAPYPKPHIAVLLGGSTNKYDFTARAMKKVITKLEQLTLKTSGALLITPSRRTGEKNIALLQSRLRANNKVYIYDGKAENPYLGLLAVSDYIIASNDSVNMMSEACATGKPVYILKLAGHRGTKPARFAESLIADGIARPLEISLQPWSYTIADEMKLITQQVKTLLAIR